MIEDNTEQLIRAVFAELPFASFTRREASTLAEAKRWTEEGIVINPTSLDVVVEAAQLAARSREPSEFESIEQQSRPMR